MKAFPHIIHKLFFEPLVITPQKHAAICQVVSAHMEGRLKASDDEDMEPEDTDDDMTIIGANAIIPVHGVIQQHMPDTPSGGSGCDLERLNAMIDIARAHSRVTRAIFDFRSPGGSVTGVPETARKIASIMPEELETIAWTDSQCCSGAIWLAAQCQKFYCTPSAQVGSVGVWCAYLDISRQMQNEGENMQAFSAGKHKLLGAYWKPMAEDEKAIIQKGVDRTYALFKAAMGTHRTSADDAYGNGLIFDGDEAAERGLTDGTAESLDELMEQLQEDGE